MIGQSQEKSNNRNENRPRDNGMSKTNENKIIRAIIKS